MDLECLFSVELPVCPSFCKANASTCFGKVYDCNIFCRDDKSVTVFETRFLRQNLLLQKFCLKTDFVVIRACSITRGDIKK